MISTGGTRTIIITFETKNIRVLYQRKSLKKPVVKAMADLALCGGVILELDSFRSPPAGLGRAECSCSDIGFEQIILPKSTRRAECSFIGHCYKQYSHHQKRIAPFVCYSLQLISNNSIVILSQVTGNLR